MTQMKRKSDRGDDAPREQTVSDHLLDLLHAWGVRRIFGYPGDAINGVMGALRRDEQRGDNRDDDDGEGQRFEFVQVANEELAGLMACALAANRPFVIDAVVDANMPTLPPQLTAEQEEKLARASAAGDPDADGVMAQIAAQEIGARAWAAMKRA